MDREQYINIQYVLLKAQVRFGSKKSILLLNQSIKIPYI